MRGFLHTSTFGLCLLLPLICLCAPEEDYAFPDAAGYTPLFNGVNLKGWKMQWQGIWEVRNRTLVGRQDPTVGKASWLFTEEEWDDFSLSLQFKITKGGNSGVAIRMPAGVEGKPSQHSFEIQISDIDKEFPTGSIYRHAAALPNVHQIEKWNDLHVIAVGDHIVVYLNRKKVLDTHLESPKRGRVGLQVHGGEHLKNQVVEFRNIKIKDLKPQYEAEKSPITFKVRQLDNLLSEGCNVVDVNRDGVLDITCGPRWYEGPEWTPHELRKVAISGEYMSNYGEFAMDVNGDEWPDILSGGWFTPELHWHENPGASGFGQLWTAHLIADDLTGTEIAFSADVDGDGHSDILLNRYNERVPVEYFAYVGLGKSVTGFERRLIGVHGRGHGGGLGDLNGDGRGDVLTPHGWYESPGRPATEAWKWHDNFDAPHCGIPMPVEDLNNDGLPDIVFGYAHDFGLLWLEQIHDSAGRQAWIYHNIDDTYSQIHCPILADLDGDGTRDLIAGKRYRGHNGSDPGANEPLCIFWYRIEKGPDPKFTKHILSYDENIGVGMTLRAVDIDRDGDIDIVAPGKTGLYLFENQRN